MSRNNKDIMKQKRDDLMAAYREVYHKCWRQQDAYRRTVRHPAPRFYVTPKQAYEVMRVLVSGDFSILETMTPMRRKMYEDMYKILLEAVTKREFQKKSLWFIIPWIVTQPAPEFYTTEETFKKIFHEGKGWRRRPRRWVNEEKRWTYEEETV